MGAVTRWQFSDADLNTVQRIASKLGISSITARLLVCRGLTEEKDAREFLYPDLSLLHPSRFLSGADQATDRLFAAIHRKQKICIYGDYDVDGITSTALLVGVLRGLGANVDFYIPSRLEEGYGLNEQALSELGAQGFDLIVSVDCGVRSVSEAANCRALDMDLIITDHHQLGEELPQAAAVVHPGLGDYPFPELAGVGVAFKLAQALVEKMGLGSMPELLLDQLDIAALGTVADVVPLLGENRILVREGLRHINLGRRIGLRELIAVTGLSGEVGSRELAFQLAPRLNAAGRLGTAEQCVELLLTSDAERAREISLNLDARNRERREIEERIWKEALDRARSEIDLDRDKLVFLASDKWHEGVQGIVASRLLEELGRPAFLFTIKDDLAKGSGRSVEGFHLHAALSECSHLLEGFGGHALAAGARIRADRLPELRNALVKQANRQLDEKDLFRRIKVDCRLTCEEVDRSLVEELEMLLPHGRGNPLPVFAISGHTHGVRRVGAGKHLKFSLRGSRRSIDAISFGHPEDEELPAWAEVAGHLRRDIWNGMERFQIKLLSARPAGQDSQSPEKFMPPVESPKPASEVHPETIINIPDEPENGRKSRTHDEERQLSLFLT